MSKKRSYRYLLYLLLRLAQGMSLALPRVVMFYVIKGISKAVWWILPKERGKVLSHLKVAFGDTKDEKELERIGRAVFENLGLTAVDTLRIPKLKKRWPKERSLVIEENVFEKVKEALKAGKGLIFLTGHIGNWELISFFVVQAGYTGTVIGRRIYYEPFNRVLEEIRYYTGAGVLYRDQSPKLILKVLKNNSTVGILPDQDVDSIEGVFVPFFGELAYTPAAPAKFSLASGAPILPVFMIREGKRYRFISDELIWPEEGQTREETVLCITKRWSAVVESVIRRYPEQWVWMHRRWKTRPEQAGALGAASSQCDEVSQKTDKAG